MTAATTRPQPEDLEFRAPDCPMCGKETETDGDCFRCYGCGASWDQRGTRGEWDDPELPQCPMVLTHAAYAVMSGRCIKTEGHAGEHDNGPSRWDAARLKYHAAVLTETEVES